MLNKYVRVFVYVFGRFGTENDLSLKSFLEAVRFIVTEYGPVASHGDRIHDNS